MIKILKKFLVLLLSFFTRQNLFVAGRHSSLLERAGRARQLVSYELNIKRQTPYSEVRAGFSLASTGICSKIKEELDSDWLRHLGFS
jgi:hypothetical protein